MLPEKSGPDGGSGEERVPPSATRGESAPFPGSRRRALGGLLIGAGS